MKRMQRAKRWIAIAIRALSLAVFVIGIGLAAYAGVQWMQTAHWQPLTVEGALSSWPTTRTWVAHPRSWLGLHKVVARTLHVPVFVIVALVGGSVLFISAP